MKKSKAIVIGNCQARPLLTTLSMSSAFAERFEFEVYPAVHVATPGDVKRLHESLADTSLLLAQFVSEGYRGRLGLGSATLRTKLGPFGTCVTWPSVFWAGYNPELFYLKDAVGASVNQQFDYHHQLVFSGYVAGHSVEQVAASFTSLERFSTAATDAEKGLKELTTRELNLDVKVSEFIAERYRSERLFWTFNHPSNSVIRHVATQVLRHLGMPQDVPPAPNELLANSTYSILPSVRNSLQLMFSEPDIYRVRWKEMSLPEMIGSYFSFYDARADLVELNRVKAL